MLLLGLELIELGEQNLVGQVQLAELVVEVMRTGVRLGLGMRGGAGGGAFVVGVGLNSHIND